MCFSDLGIFCKIILRFLGICGLLVRIIERDSYDGGFDFREFCDTDFGF